MNDVIMSVTNKLPPEYMMVMIPLLLITGVWLFTHIRRDKQGKIYFYSDKYETNKRNIKQNKMLDILTDVKKDIEESKADRIDMHLENLKQSIFLQDPFPMEERIYAGLRYIKSGGNGIVRHYVVDELIKNNPIIYKTIINMYPNLEVKI